MGMATEAQFHVLAVDDSIIDRKLIERLFKISSYHVTTVESGSKALEFLGLVEDDQNQIKKTSNPLSVPSGIHQEMEVNLVITDYCMPGMTGYDLLKKIKESSSLKDIPVVIMSSENVPSRITRCLEEGAEEFLLKPVRLADVNRLKPHVLRGKSRENNITPEEVQKKEKKQVIEEKIVVVQEPEQQSTTQQQASSNVKRKIMEEISPEKTRTRYSEFDNNLIRLI